MKTLKFSILLMFVPFVCFTQTKDEAKPQNYIVPAIIENGDTVPCITLHEVFIFPELKFKNRSQEKFYWKTVRDVKKTLPYAKLAGKLINETNADLSKLSTDRERKEYIKLKEKQLFGQFEDDLKKMTISQGKMLVRLIDRECDKTTYDIIKMYKGNFSAFFWQSLAKVFGSNLKMEYDGEDKDKIIERVIILVEAGQL